MSNPKHTPGPWKAIQTSLDHTRMAIVGPDGFNTPLAWVITSDPTGRANAAIMAAAPDLLAELESLVFAADDDNIKCINGWKAAAALVVAIHNAREAIAKAKGGA